MAAWSASFINKLPDSCFLFVQSGGTKDSEGKTVPRSFRHFPYKGADGKIDLPHLRNAIARIPQSNAPGLSREKKTALQEKARRMLEKEGGGAKAHDILDLRAVPERFDLEATGVEWIEAVDGDPDKPKRFTMTAYTGGVMSPPGWSAVVIDLAGLEVASESVPILLDHNQTKIVGHSDSIEKTAQTLKLAGVVSGAGPEANQMLASSKLGFPWKASVGVKPKKVEYVPEGSSAKANGRTFPGPCSIVRTGLLGEVSFVAVAADPKTRVSVAATASKIEEITTMEFTEWVKAKGFDPETLSDIQRSFLQAMYDQENAEPETPLVPETPATPETPPVRAVQASAPTAGDDLVAKEREKVAVEFKRIDALQKVEGMDQHPDLLAKAITEGWDTVHAELAILRLARPQAPAAHRGGPSLNLTTLECAMRLGSGETEALLEKRYGDKILEASLPWRHIGIKDAIRACAALDGRPVPNLSPRSDDWIRAGFSTATLPTLLSNTANKVMMDSYRTLPSTATLVARKLSANDFKTHTGVRLTGDFKMQKVGASGEIEHAKVDDDSFTFQVHTYARMFGITRQMLKNDDLGAFLEIPRLIGRGAALALEDAFWTLVLANTGSFFVAGNNNYISGATTVLGSVGLGLGVEKFLKQTDPDGNPIALDAKYLVVPPELKVTADELWASRNINTGGAATTEKVPDANVWAARYQPLCSPYLSNSNYTGYSTTAWYLFANPLDIAAFGIAYLDGVETPTIEDAPLSSDILGQAWRGYFDFGVCQIDKRGGVKSKGAA